VIGFTKLTRDSNEKEMTIEAMKKSNGRNSFLDGLIVFLKF
jgi:hypothetical protein